MVLQHDETGSSRSNTALGAQRLRVVNWRTEFVDATRITDMRRSNHGLIREVVICSPVRTAIGTYGGTFKDTPAADLGGVVVRAALERAKLSPGDLDSVVMGNVVQAGNKMNPARQAAIHGGVPVGNPADDRQPCLRLGRSSDCERGAGGDAWLHR